MATIVLSAAGMAAGGVIGGSVLGLSSAVIGRAVGATLGRVIDQRLLGAGEGTAIAQLHGRMRIPGQVIWATEFREHRTRSGAGKGGAPQPATTEYSYSISLGIALCEGEVARVGRVWADGQEVAPEELNMRLHPGTPDQLPDPKIEAVEGTGQAPAYRGTAYVVMEDLALGPFGNRVPQFTFEVMRPDQGGGPVAGIDSAIRAVSMIPGTGEYALATTPVYLDHGFGNRAAVNLNAASGKTDFVTSLDALQEELPHCGSATLVVSWFGDDLRCDACTLRPKVDQKEADGAAIPWRVSGLARAQSQEVAAQDGVKLYGGTPADAAVIEAIGALRERGLSPVFYPFVLMDQITGNTLTDPWTGAEGQPHLPWRGRITASLADGLDGSPMGTAQAEAQVAAFLGQAQPGDFSVAGDTVSYHGPAEWSYRRMILHYAHLCAAAGGVDAFLLGSELRGLTQVRGAVGFPFVAGLVTLLEAVRVDPSVYDRHPVPGSAPVLTPHVAPIPVELMLMDLPLMRGDEGEIAPHAAVSGVHWPGSVALHASDQDAGYALERVLHHPAVIGVTQTPMAAAQTGTWDRGTALRVRLIRGTLDSLSPAGVLGGGNLAAIGDGGADRWELFQFAEATLVGARTYDLRRRLRGQAGSDGLMPETWPAGSVFVLMDGVPEQIALAPAARGTLRHYRYGPATRPMSDPSYQYRAETFRGNGLRPYPVAHLRAVPKGDDLAVSWVRRTRIEGDSWDQAEVPLGEARERYRVQVRAGETLLREVTRDSPHWIYDAGAQASDGAGGTITLSVAQISDRYGPGPARDLTVSL
ncbi:glycoside hydrolase TIM-barrel-like domain-containing protein [Roseovarius sp. SYSU LYC5161]|uniref:GTA baseplate fiber-binding domain-containing protein n=1 Tax=Roseovarius halophilus (ex Wu et al. 2025) TaxID=3376060 RepID=UPI0039996054